MNRDTKTKPNVWSWVPTLYFAEGIPNVVIVTVAVIMYKRLGISNTDIALYTGLLYLPWVIKPLWSPFVEFIKTKRWWIVNMQIIIAIGLAAVAFALPLSLYFSITISVFWLMAFCSATNDIASDGFYMIELDSSQQSLFVGIRSVFYRFASIAGQGLLVMMAGYLEMRNVANDSLPSRSNIISAWSFTFYAVAAIYAALAIYHLFFLPRPKEDISKNIRPNEILREFANSFTSYFQKREIVVAMLFMLLYRLGESMLVKMSSPFLLDGKDLGGLALSTSSVGLVYGTVGVVALMIGGIVGGIAISLKGLRYWMFPMALSITLPNAVYLFLSYYLPENLFVVNAAIAIEQFGYGFGFTAYMMYLIYFSKGEFQTAHYAISTGFMALGLMLPGMLAGWLQNILGYQYFFILIMILSIPTLIVAKIVKIDSEFGKKQN